MIVVVLAGVVLILWNVVFVSLKWNGLADLTPSEYRKKMNEEGLPCVCRSKATFAR